MTTSVLRNAWAVVTLLFAVPGVLAAETQKPELLLVYWGSDDCRWCTYWESSRSGMDQQLRESEEFKRITYRVVKNKRLADPYTPADFPTDILWVYERIQRGEERRPGRPGWILYVDRKRIAGFYGATHWELQHFPEIQRLIRMHLGSDHVFLCQENVV